MVSLYLEAISQGLNKFWACFPLSERSISLMVAYHNVYAQAGSLGKVEVGHSS